MVERKSPRGSSTAAIAQPLLGIAILLITRHAGRSGLMGGALILSILMLIDGTWTAPGWMGAASSVLLLVADFGTTGRPHRLLAEVLAVGYAALVIWSAWWWARSCSCNRRAHFVKAPRTSGGSPSSPAWWGWVVGRFGR